MFDLIIRQVRISSIWTPNNLVDLEGLCSIGQSSIFKFMNLAFVKFCREPIVMQLVLEVLQLNLLVWSQSCTAAKTQFKEHPIVDIP